jgi:SRSO17 transposase
LEEILAAKADALVGGDDAVLVIDDTAVPKKGTHSVGVAPQQGHSVLVMRIRARAGGRS